MIVPVFRIYGLDALSRETVRMIQKNKTVREILAMIAEQVGEDAETVLYDILLFHQINAQIKIPLAGAWRKFLFGDGLSKRVMDMPLAMRGKHFSHPDYSSRILERKQ